MSSICLKGAPANMMSRPKGIYLEASVLCKLPRDVVTAEIERLKELSTKLELPIFIPEASFLEWIATRKESINKYITNVDTGLAEMSKLFDYVLNINWTKNKKDIIADTETFTRRIIERIGINVIETPQIDLKKLLSMAVDKVKPFETKGEKGFRDSVNLFTVLEHAKQQEKGSHIFVAEDQVYQVDEIQNHAKEYNVELIVVPSITEAITTLEEFMKNVKMLIDTYQKTILREFLLQNVDKISEYIRQHGEFPIYFLNQDYQLGFWPSIEDIEVADIKGIESITRGVLPHGENEGRVKVSFTAKTMFKVKVSEPILRSEPKFKHGGKVPPPFDLRAFLTGNRQIVDKKIEVGVPVEGYVLLKKVKDDEGVLNDEYSNLEFTGIAIR